MIYFDRSTQESVINRCAAISSREDICSPVTPSRWRAWIFLCGRSKRRFTANRNNETREGVL
ncbi:MAG: hypothetical protein WDO73_12945 [Ignavibacteriota bacterium]